MRLRKVCLCAGWWLCALVSSAEVVHLNAAGTELPPTMPAGTLLACAPYEGAKMRAALYADAPYQQQGTARLAVVNQTDKPVTIKLYHPDEENPGQRAFSATVIEPQQNRYLGEHYYGADWGIQVNQSCIRYVGQVSDWNYLNGEYIFQTWPAKITATSTRESSSAAQDLETKDIILSANGAAGSQDWEYNAHYDEGWVQHTINWQPKGRVAKVQWRCVANLDDDRKFQYRVKLDNGRMILVMKATTKERGLIRLQLTALTN